MDSRHHEQRGIDRKKPDRSIAFGLLILLLVILLFVGIILFRPGFFQSFSPVF